MISRFVLSFLHLDLHLPKLTEDSHWLEDQFNTNTSNPKQEKRQPKQLRDDNKPKCRVQYDVFDGLVTQFDNSYTIYETLMGTT